jgi:uncharacterized protein YkwD
MSAASRAAAGFALSAVLLLCSPLFAAPAHGADCPGADSGDGTSAARAAALLCLAGDARVKAGRLALRVVTPLKRSAAAKAATIERCGVFSHTPCDTSMAVAMRRTGYARGCFTVGENLAWVTPGATPREVLRAWLDSPGHRANLLGARFRDTGVARRFADLDGIGRVELWVQHFGVRC